MSTPIEALTKTQPDNSFNALIQQAPQPQGLTPTVVPLDRETLQFYGSMVTMAGLVPVEKGVTPEMSKFRVMAKIVAGTSYGFDPILAQQCFDVLHNRMTPNAHAMEILFKDSGEFDTRIDYLTDEGCKVIVLKRQNGDWDAARGQYTGGTWTAIGEVEFTKAMAVKAGWDSNPLWRTDPADMCYSKVMKRVVKRFHPSCLRPRMLLGNNFAKQAPQVEAVPAPQQIADTQHISVDPSPTGTAYVDPPYTEAVFDDDAAEAEVVEYSGSPDVQIEPDLTTSKADPDEEGIRQDLIIGVETLLDEKFGDDKIARAKFLKSRVPQKLTAAELSDMHETLLTL